MMGDIFESPDDQLTAVRAFQRGRAQGRSEGKAAAFTAMESDEALEAAEWAWHNGPGAMRAVLVTAVAAAKATLDEGNGEA